MTMMPPCPPLTPEFAVLPPTYVPSIDDVPAWSGAAAPPRGEWLPLYDDGPVSKGGHEPEGQVAGDDVYSNVWQTPSVPSDFIIDIITYDQAFDPLGRGPGQNWKIWDNVWGFTTQAVCGAEPDPGRDGLSGRAAVPLHDRRRPVLDRRRHPGGELPAGPGRESVSEDPGAHGL